MHFVLENLQLSQDRRRSFLSRRHPVAALMMIAKLVTYATISKGSCRGLIQSLSLGAKMIIQDEMNINIK